MSYELYTQGSIEPQKMKVSCPKCGQKNEILWFPAKKHSYRATGTTGGSEMRFSGSSEKVHGVCTDCGYKFKTDDLD